MNIDGYVLLCKDCNSKKGGGVGICVHNNKTCIIIFPHLYCHSASVELLYTECHWDDVDYYIAGCYRLPYARYYDTASKPKLIRDLEI